MFPGNTHNFENLAWLKKSQLVIGWARAGGRLETMVVWPRPDSAKIEGPYMPIKPGDFYHPPEPTQLAGFQNGKKGPWGPVGTDFFLLAPRP